MPKRIQRKRTKGWQMPAGVVYVGRPSIWGNPFWYVALEYTPELAVALYREMVQGIWNPSLVADLPDREVTRISQSHQQWLRRLQHHPLELMRVELRGRDLSCWCGLDKPCHVDPLLELANR